LPVSAETSRFHFRHHTEQQFALHNSSKARDDPTLWHVTPEGQETFLWNSSRAESNYSWLSEGGLQNWRRYRGILSEVVGPRRVHHIQPTTSNRIPNFNSVVSLC
ncbi:unnamed protein product, partial [Ectocarpus sp. 12 AP-2014]